MNRAEVLESCVKEFWDNRKVKAFKKKGDYHFMLADHKNEVLSDLIKDNNIPFTIINYLNLHKLTRPRLYLFTKLKSATSKILELSKAVDLTSDDSDSEDSTTNENSAVSLSSTNLSDQVSTLNASLNLSTAESSIANAPVERSVTELIDQESPVSSLLKHLLFVF